MILSHIKLLYKIISDKRMLYFLLIVAEISKEVYFFLVIFIYKKDKNSFFIYICGYFTYILQ